MVNSTTRKAHILSVGQGLADQRRLSACLPESRWRVDHASCVHSACKLLASTAYDAIISEIRLRDGRWTALRGCGSAAPIIIASDCIDARLWAEALSQGAYDVLVKPFNTEELLHVVQNACLRRLLKTPADVSQPAFR